LTGPYDEGDDVLKKIRAIAVVSGLWACTWALTGTVINTWRFFVDVGHVDGWISNLWLWARVGIEVGGSGGLLAGAAFGMMLTLLPPLTGSRISSRWSVAYGIVSGLIAPLFLLPIGYGTVVLPFFAGLFSVTGAATAFGIAAVANPKSIVEIPQEALV
jgi:hypothetical protein